MTRMILLSATLLLAISRVAVSQCQYVYVAEPPSGQLICDPFPVNRLQLVCSVFVTDIGQPDTLRLQWFFGAPDNRQFNPSNVQLLQEVQFNVTLTRETYTSRIVVSSPPGGFYFCQPLLLTSSVQLIRSNVVPLQPQSFYQDRGIRPCLENEFQNSTVPFCAEQGVTLGPDQIIEPAPTVMIIETVQTIAASVGMRPSQSGLLVIEKTPLPSNTLSGGTNTVTESSSSADTTTTMIEDDSNDGDILASDNLPAGVIAGVVLVTLSVVVCTILFSILIVFVRSKMQQGNKFGVTNANRYLESPDGLDGKSQEVTTHDRTDERTYDYPKADSSTIQVSRNEAYATNIFAEKNAAYKPVSPSGTVDEYYVYEYI